MINLLVIAAISTQFPIWPVAQSLLIVTNCLWRGLLPGEVPNSPHLVCCLGWEQIPALAKAPQKASQETGRRGY